MSINNSATKEEQAVVYDNSYLLDCVVGRGRNSVVYLAKPTHSLIQNEKVALKVLSIPRKDRKEFSKKVRREADAMFACVHPHVVRLFDHTQTCDEYYLAMEYVNGGNLRYHLEHSTGLPPLKIVLNSILQLLSGLEAVHRAGFIHRDIKPENILLSDSGNIKLADFGIAIRRDEGLQDCDASRGVGTFEYIAPECLSSGEVTTASDIFSVGVVLYELLTKTLPYQSPSIVGQVEAKVQGEFPPVCSYRENTPVRLEQVLQKALHPDPRQRFKTPGRFGIAIKEVLADVYGPKTVVRPSVNITSQIEMPPISHIIKEASEITGNEDEAKEQVSANSVISTVTLVGRTMLTMATAAVLLFIVANTGMFGNGVANANTQLPEGLRYPSMKHAMEVLASRTGLASQSIASTQELHEAFLSSRSGQLYGLLSERDNVSFYTTVSADKSRLILMVNVPGTTPIAIPLESISINKPITISWGGVRISLSFSSNKLVPGSTISGVYRDLQTGHTGHWALF